MAAPEPGAGQALAVDKRKRILRYTGVNLVSVVLDYAIFLGLTSAFGLPTAASVIGYLAALVLNYDLSKRFVFGDDGSHKSEHRLFLEFFATGILGLVLTAAITWFEINIMGRSPVYAKTIAVLICFVVLYFVRSRLVFVAKPQSAETPSV